MKTDLRKAGIEEDQTSSIPAFLRSAARQDVFEEEQERSGLHQQVSPHIFCPECNRRFRREGDRKRHKCAAK